MKLTLFLFLTFTCIVLIDNVFAKKASLDISDIISNLKTKTDTVIILPPEELLPDGWVMICKGKTKKGILTLKCSKEKMINMAIEHAYLMGAGAIQLYDIREPSIINTCYKFKVRFLVRSK